MQEIADDSRLPCCFVDIRALAETCKGSVSLMTWHSLQLLCAITVLQVLRLWSVVSLVCLIKKHRPYHDAQRSFCTSSLGGSVFKTMARNALATNCVSQYHQYIWGCCFGLVTVISAPLLAVVGLALGLYKSVHDYCFNRGLLRA
jgi:hypothetical protein